MTARLRVKSRRLQRRHRPLPVRLSAWPAARCGAEPAAGAGPGGDWVRRRGVRPAGSRPRPLSSPSCDDEKLRRRHGGGDGADDWCPEKLPPAEAEQHGAAAASNLTDEQKAAARGLFRRQSSERWDLLTVRLRRLMLADVLLTAPARLTRRPQLTVAGDTVSPAVPAPERPPPVGHGLPSTPLSWQVRRVAGRLLRGCRGRLSPATAELRRCGVCAGLRPSLRRPAPAAAWLRWLYDQVLVSAAVLLLLRLVTLLLSVAVHAVLG